MLALIKDHYWQTRYEADVFDAARRVLEVGAKAPLTYKGMGAYGVVFCDARGVGYKAARQCDDGDIEDEAEWLRVASSDPQIRRHVAGYRHYFRKQCVIERECIRAAPLRRRSDPGVVYDVIAKVMFAHGFGMPEFKEENFVFQSGRGWVLVDASAPILRGRRLVARAAQVLRGDRFRDERPADVAWALRMEAGRTVDPGRAQRLSDRLEALPDARDRSKVRRRS